MDDFWSKVMIDNWLYTQGSIFYSIFLQLAFAVSFIYQQRAENSAKGLI